MHLKMSTGGVIEYNLKNNGQNTLVAKLMDEAKTIFEHGREQWEMKKSRPDMNIMNNFY
jgi:hypothetical protein